MSPSALIISALLWGLIHPAYKPTTTKVYGEGEWVLTVATDNFTRETRCTLANHHGRNPNVTVIPGALAFRFSPKRDTSNAWYKIGDRPPQAARDGIAKLVATGSLAEAERLDNPSGGVVLIPLDDLKDAQAVTVQPAPKASPQRFKLTDAWSMIASARQLGCGLELMQTSTSQSTQIGGR